MLNETLAAVGINRAFDGETAEFQPMFAHTLTAETNVYITQIAHKTFIKVNEEGTEAAAATAVSMGELGIPEVPRPRPRSR